MVKEIEPLLGKIAGVNTKLLESQREASLKQIAAQHKSVQEELKRVDADEKLVEECLQGFQRLQSQVRGQDSLAHINQAEADAIGQKDIALEKISKFVSKPKDEACEEIRRFFRWNEIQDSIQKSACRGTKKHGVSIPRNAG